MTTSTIKLKRIIRVICIAFISIVLLFTSSVMKTNVYADYIDEIDEQCKDYQVLTVDMIVRDSSEYYLPSGNYRLESDFYSNHTIGINRGDVSIYLNGHELQALFYCNSNFTVLDNSKKEGKFLATYSGQVPAVMCDGGTIRLKNIKVKDASSTVIDAHESKVYVDDCIFEGNLICFSNGLIEAYDSFIRINNSVITNNEQEYTNTQYLTYTVRLAKNSRVELYNCEISNNYKNDKTGFGTIGIKVEDGEDQYLQLSGNTKISGNGTGIILGKGNHLYLLDEVNISGNNINDLYIPDVEDEGPYIFFSSDGDFPGLSGKVPDNGNGNGMFTASSANGKMNVNLSLALAKKTSLSDSLVYIASNDVSNEEINQMLHRADGGPFAVIEGAEGQIFVGANYIVEGNTIRSTCSLCGKSGSISLDMSDFDDKENRAYIAEGDLSFRIRTTKSSWKDAHYLSYPTVVYGYVDPETGKVSEYSEEEPSEPGAYTVKLAILTKESDFDSAYVSTEETYFTIVNKEACNHQETYILCENNQILARCKNCNHIVDKAELGTNKRDISNCVFEDGIYFVPLCTDEEIAIRCGNEEYFEDLSIVYGYYQNDGSIKYSLKAPTQKGKYTAHLALLEDDNNPNSAIISNKDIVFEICAHYWVYDVDGITMTADCAYCKEHAYVTLDRSGAEYASRNYNDESKEEYFEYDIFYQNNWTGQEDIRPFYILYNGIAIVDEQNSTLNKDVLYKPTITGNYTARVVLLNDTKDPENVYLGTELLSYYLAGNSMGNPYLKITEYSEEQYMMLKEPAMINGFYQVGTLEDLLWASHFGGPSVKINIIDDIIVNPLTVSDDGETVRCGSNIIYAWNQMYNIQGQFSGTINGNGHTLYGLYCRGNYTAGLISHGLSCQISNLTISDSVFQATDYAGGICAVMGWLNPDYSSITNCNVLNSTIGSQRAAGGIIGDYRGGHGATHLTIDGCLVDCNINGQEYAGGIIGLVDKVALDGHDFIVEIKNTINMGDINGGYAVGGIVGTTSAPTDYKVQNCINTGDVNAQCAAGGLFGVLNPQEGSIITDNISIGKIVSIDQVDFYYGRYDGGLVGTYYGSADYFYQYHQGDPYLDLTDNKYYGSTQAIGNIDDKTLNRSAKLSKSNATLAKMCKYFGNHVLDNKYVLTEAGDCTHDGKMIKTCLVCSKVYDTIKVHAHGHCYINGICFYCNENEDAANVASVFSESGTGLYVSIAVIVVACITILIISKKKKVKP